MRRRSGLEPCRNRATQGRSDRRGNFNQLFNPANAADERILPFFKENARPVRERSRGFGDLLEAAAKVIDQCEPLLRFADKARKDGDHVKDSGNTPLVEVQYGSPRRTRLRVISACTSQKVRMRSGLRSRIASMSASRKAETRGFERTSGGRFA